MKRILCSLLGGPMIEGDQVAIRWRFTFAFKDGGKLQQEEVAWRTWRESAFCRLKAAETVALLPCRSDRPLG